MEHFKSVFIFCLLASVSTTWASGIETEIADDRFAYGHCIEEISQARHEITGSNSLIYAYDSMMRDKMVIFHKFEKQTFMGAERYLHRVYLYSLSMGDYDVCEFDEKERYIDYPAGEKTKLRLMLTGNRPSFTGTSGVIVVTLQKSVPGFFSHEKKNRGDVSGVYQLSCKQSFTCNIPTGEPGVFRKPCGNDKMGVPYGGAIPSRGIKSELNQYLTEKLNQACREKKSADDKPAADTAKEKVYRKCGKAFAMDLSREQINNCKEFKRLDGTLPSVQGTTRPSGNPWKAKVNVGN